MDRIVFVNGAYTPESQATVSIFDRGYVFGDGVYEVVPVIGGKMVDKTPFLERLDRSLNELQIPSPMSKADYVAMHEALIERNNLSEGSIYSQVTRGAAERDFPFPKDIKPGVMAFTQSRSLLENPHAETGVKVATVEDLRWSRRDIKSIALLAQVLAKQRAAEKGAFEGWMVEDGHITEGTSSSAYIVKNGVVITRPLSNEILPGIRRRVLFELVEKGPVTIEQRRFTVAEALEADEAFLSSATNFILPIIEIDGQKIGTGTPGPIAKRLREIYIAKVKQEAGLA